MKASDFTISFVIPNWNGRDLLDVHLPNVIHASNGSEIIVVDDASTDDSVELLQKKFPGVHVVQQKTNKGFSSTVNMGVSKASGDIVVLLNTDIDPESGFLAPLISHFEDDAVFAVGCLEKSKEEENTVLRGRGEAIWSKGFFVHRRGEVNKENTAWVSGGSGAFRKTFWKKLGGLDEIYNPFYWEDIDLSYRAMKSGYILVFESKSVVVHKHEQGSIKTSTKERDVKKIAFRNQLLFIWKNITDISLMAEHILYLPLQLLRSLFAGDSTYLSGFFLAIRLLPTVLKKRGEGSEVFVMTDKQLLGHEFHE